MLGDFSHTATKPHNFFSHTTSGAIPRKSWKNSQQTSKNIYEELLGEFLIISWINSRINPGENGGTTGDFSEEWNLEGLMEPATSGETGIPLFYKKNIKNQNMRKSIQFWDFSRCSVMDSSRSSPRISSVILLGLTIDSIFFPKLLQSSSKIFLALLWEFIQNFYRNSSSCFPRIPSDHQEILLEFPENQSRSSSCIHPGVPREMLQEVPGNFFRISPWNSLGNSPGFFKNSSRSSTGISPGVPENSYRNCSKISSEILPENPREFFQKLLENSSRSSS